jgi:hypothetical protein
MAAALVIEHFDVIEQLHLRRAVAVEALAEPPVPIISETTSRGRLV